MARRCFQRPLHVGAKKAGKCGPVVPYAGAGMQGDFGQLVKAVVTPSGHQGAAGRRNGQCVDDNLGRGGTGIGSKQSPVFRLFQTLFGPPGAAEMRQPGCQDTAADGIGDVGKGPQIGGFVEIGIHRLVEFRLPRRPPSASVPSYSAIAAVSIVRRGLTSWPPRPVAWSGSSGETIARTILGRTVTRRSTAIRLGPAWTQSNSPMLT